MTETAHKVERREVASGETIESMGFTPDQIIAKRPIYKDWGTRRQVLEVWFMTEVEVDE